SGRARRSERECQEIKISVAIESLEVGMVQDIEGIGAQFQADMLCVGYLECFLHRDIYFVERRASACIAASVAVQELEVNGLACKSIYRTQGAGIAVRQEGVLNRVALRPQASGNAGCNRTWPKKSIGTIK